MNNPCLICKGACCETIVIKEDALSPAQHVWISLHGEIKLGLIELNCKCKRLLEDGSCGNYENRPDMCREFPVGGAGCLNTIARRRNNDPKILQAIKDFAGTQS